MPGMNMFPGGTTLQIPLDAPAGFTAKAGNAQVTLTWTDPKDKYATPEGETAQDPDQLVSVWDHTVLVRKTGSQPAGPNDGTVVVSSSVRDQYASAGYVDTGLQNNTTYYYGVFAYNTDGVASPGAFASAMPRSWDPILENNTWAEIKEAADLGLAESIWQVGDTKNFTVSGQTMTAVILGFGMDNLTNGGKAAITFGTKNCMADRMEMGIPLGSSFFDTDYSQYVNDTLPGQLTSDLSSVLETVIAQAEEGSANLSLSPESESATLFVPTRKNVIGEGTTSVGQYPYYAVQSSRMKSLSNGLGSATSWLVAVHTGNIVGTGTYHYCGVIGSDGSYLLSLATSEYGVNFNFCVGKKP